MKAFLALVVLFLVVSFGDASHSRKGKSKAAKHEETDVNGAEDSDWPKPDEIRHFGVPPSFTEDPSNGDGNEMTTTPGNRHHGKSHHKNKN